MQLGYPSLKGSLWYSESWRHAVVEGKGSNRMCARWVLCLQHPGECSAHTRKWWGWKVELCIAKREMQVSRQPRIASHTGQTLWRPEYTSITGKTLRIGIMEGAYGVWYINNECCNTEKKQNKMEKKICSTFSNPLYVALNPENALQKMPLDFILGPNIDMIQSFSRLFLLLLGILLLLQVLTVQP